MVLFYILANAVAYFLIFVMKGINLVSVLYCMMVSALIVLSVIDMRTFEIPNGFHFFIMVLGLIRLVTDFENWKEYIIGMFAVSSVLLLLYVVTGGRAIGGGDIKLMAVCGLVLGWELIWIALFIGCAIGAVIHLIRMKIWGVGNTVAMGPYLSAGVLISVLCGERLLR